MSTEDRMNRWAAELISLPKEAVHASVDYQEFTSSLPSAVLVLNAMVKDEYNVSLDITDGQATVVFTDDDGEGRATGDASELALHIVTAAYQVEGSEDDEEDDEEEGDADS